MLTGCPRGIWPMPEGHQGPPVVPGDLGPGPKHRRVDQLSRAIRALAQGPVVSTSHPGQLRSGSEGPRGRPDVPGDSAPGPRALNVNQIFRALGPGSEGPRGRPTVPRNSGPCPKARVFEQLSRATQPGSEGSRAQPSLSRMGASPQFGEVGPPRCMRGVAGPGHTQRPLCPLPGPLPRDPRRQAAASVLTLEGAPCGPPGRAPRASPAWSAWKVRDARAVDPAQGAGGCCRATQPLVSRARGLLASSGFPAPRDE